ncbi:MAG: DUF2341 domain-containing protein [Thermoplasmata archaeon]|nr:DUF2341 domain-containing protein [Thermoplasmata archaeon]
MRKNLLKNKRAVSEVVGYILMITIASTVLAATIYTSSQIIDRKITEVGSYQAKALANQIADAIVDVTWIKRSLPDANYERIIKLPDDIAGLSYYIQLTDDAVYVNTSDGRISEKSTTYKAKDLGIGVSGKVYGGTGNIKIACNKTEYVYRFDFGPYKKMGNSKIPSSPVQTGYYWVSNATKIGGDSWDDPSRPYRVILEVLNTGNGTHNLSNYWVSFDLDSSNFDYNFANESGLDLEIYNLSGIQLPCWIEKWNPNGTSTVWFMIDNISKNETKYFYLYYGNRHPVVNWNFLYLPDNKSKLYNNYPNDNFLFYDDFNYPDKIALSHVWTLHQTTNIEAVDGEYATLGYNDTIITKGRYVFPPGPPREVPSKGNITSNVTQYVIDVKVNISDNDATNSKTADLDILPVTTTSLDLDRSSGIHTNIYYPFCLPLVKSSNTPNASSIWRVMKIYGRKGSNERWQIKTDCLGTSIGGCAGDRWSIIHVTIYRMYVYDWTNTSKVRYEEYNATSFAINSMDNATSQLFNSVSGGAAFNGTIGIPIYTVTGDIGGYEWESAGVNDNSHVGVGCGMLYDMNESAFPQPSQNQRVYVDWIDIRKEAMPGPIAIVDGRESINYGWSDATDIDAVNTIQLYDSLLVDFNNATSTNNFTITNLSAGTYSITITMGDYNCSHTTRVNVSVNGSSPYTVIPDLTTNAGEFETRWFTVTLQKKGNISLIFDNDGDGNGWVVNAITIEKGIKGVRVEVE